MTGDADNGNYVKFSTKELVVEVLHRLDNFDKRLNVVEERQRTIAAFVATAKWAIPVMVALITGLMYAYR